MFNSPVLKLLDHVVDVLKNDENEEFQYVTFVILLYNYDLDHLCPERKNQLKNNILNL